MTYIILTLLGRILAAAPVFFAQSLAWVFGGLFYYGFAGRRRNILSNLHHAFPEKTARNRRAIARESCRRMIEMSLFVLASPYFSDARIRKNFKADKSIFEGNGRLDEPGVPAIIVTPHFSLMEALTLTHAIYPKFDRAITVGAFYRPFRNAGIERWVKTTRERHGMRLLSRKAGFGEAMHILKNNGRTVVLFDQNAGGPGALSLFFNRVASTSELAGLLAEKYKTYTLASYIERTGFWRGIYRSERICDTPDAEVVTIAANAWLERKLRQDDNHCADWLWAHKRWHVCDSAPQRFHLAHKRDIIPQTLAAHSLTAHPRNERFWIRMPNWLGDVVMAVPLIRALRRSRPDAEITLIVKKQFEPLLRQLGIAEKIIPLPERGLRYWFFFRRLRNEYPDTYILFSNSRRGDLEARLTKTPQRFGIIRKKKSRPLLTHGWKIPAGIDESRLHQTRLWERWFREHGLAGEVSLEPFSGKCPAASTTPVIGMVCGTENSPAKRWPVEHWRTLIFQLLAERPVKIILFGTARDKAITETVAQEMPAGAVVDLAGKTDLPAFADALTACRCLVCNDTGGMHLANMFGVPVIGIFGPTNPVRSGPIFNAPAIILQPDNCPPTGGGAIKDVTPERVAEACLTFCK